MKGLLLKEWYMVKKYCRYHLICAIGFLILSLMSEGNMFFIFYPCLLCGMIPIHLLGYDERSRWLQYSGALPYTREQIVSAKYLTGLFAQVAFLIVMGVAQGIKMNTNGNFVPNDFLVLLLLMLSMAAFTPSIALPFSFRMGVEKGRTAYYVMVGFVCAASFVATDVFHGQEQATIKPALPLATLSFAGICVYALSWYLSIVFYKKREL